MRSKRNQSSPWQAYLTFMLRTFYRIWPLLLTLALQAPLGLPPDQKMSSLGISAMAVAIALLFFLMTEDVRHKPREDSAIYL